MIRLIELCKKGLPVIGTHQTKNPEKVLERKFSPSQGIFPLGVDQMPQITKVDPEKLIPQNNTGTNIIDKFQIAREIISKIPKPSLFTLDFWRGQLADIVMQDEKMVPKFNALTDRFLELEKGTLSIFSKAKAFKAELETQFPKDEQKNLPRIMQLGLWASNLSNLATYIGFKFSVRQAARLFIAGETTGTALKVIDKLQKMNSGYILDFVAEEVKSEDEAKANLEKYFEAFEKLPPTREKVVSIKLSGLVPNFGIERENETTDILQAVLTLNQLMIKAKEAGALIVIDLEQFDRKDLTIKIFEEFHRGSNYQYVNNLGIVSQTYLKSSGSDVDRLVGFANECYDKTAGNSKLFIRFVKGAYQNSDKAHVLEGHEAVNQRYIDCLRTAFSVQQEKACLRITIASHNMRTVCEAQSLAQEFRIEENSLEYEMLLGMPAHPILLSLAKTGKTCRFYMPVGKFEESIGYFMRRMKENASSSSCQQLFKQYQKGKITLEEYLEQAFFPVAQA